MTSHDCKPTLTDTQVIDFCRNGYLMLEGVVPDDVNRQAREAMDMNGVEFGCDEPRFGEQHRYHNDGAHMYLWLCGKGDRFDRPSGPGWPHPPARGSSLWRGAGLRNRGLEPVRVTHLSCS